MTNKLERNCALLTALILTAPLMIGSASAQATSEACLEHIASLTASVGEAEAQRVAMREDVIAAAHKHPLIVTMSDGRIVNLAGEAPLSEPFESWFVNEDVIAEKQDAQRQAEGMAAAEDFEACLGVGQ